MGAAERVRVGAAGRLLATGDQRVEYLPVVQMRDEVPALANIQRGVWDS